MPACADPVERPHDGALRLTPAAQRYPQPRLGAAAWNAGGRGEKVTGRPSYGLISLGEFK